MHTSPPNGPEPQVREMRSTYSPFTLIQSGGNNKNPERYQNDLPSRNMNHLFPAYVIPFDDTCLLHQSDKSSSDSTKWSRRSVQQKQSQWPQRVSNSRSVTELTGVRNLRSSIFVRTGNTLGCDPWFVFLPDDDNGWWRRRRLESSNLVVRLIIIINGACPGFGFLVWLCAQSISTFPSTPLLHQHQWVSSILSQPFLAST